MDHSLNTVSAASERKAEPSTPEPAQPSPTAQPAASTRKRWRLALVSTCVVMGVVGAGSQIAITSKGGPPLTKQAANTLSILEQALMDTMWPAAPKALATANTTTDSKDESNWEFANDSADLPADNTAQEIAVESQRSSAPSKKFSSRVAPSAKPADGTAQACPDAARVCIASPESGATVRGVVQVKGTATAPNFAYYKFEFENDSRCRDPQDGRPICFLDIAQQPKTNDTLVMFDTRETTLGARIPNGTYWVRLVVVDQTGNELPQKARIQITIQN